MTEEHTKVIRSLEAQNQAQIKSMAVLIRKLNRRNWRAILVVALISVAAITMSVFLGGVVAGWRAEQQQVEAALESTSDIIAELKATNEELKAQGKDTVPVPSTTDDPEAVDMDALAALTAAKVLAQLPPPVPGPAGHTPTAEELAPLIAIQVASYVAANPPADGQTPSIEELTAITIAVVADYFTANPPEPGPKGDKGDQGDPGQQGEPGRPPTAEEIRAQVDAWIAEHPPPYCPAGYSATPASVLTLDGPREGVFCFLDPTPPEEPPS